MSNETGDAIMLTLTIDGWEKQWSWAAWNENYQKVAEGYSDLPTKEAVVDYLNNLKTELFHATFAPEPKPMDAKTRERWLKLRGWK
jgi:hypothetical protein